MSGSTERADVQAIRKALRPKGATGGFPNERALAALDSLAAALRAAEEALRRIDAVKHDGSSGDALYMQRVARAALAAASTEGSAVDYASRLARALREAPTEHLSEPYHKWLTCLREPALSEYDERAAASTEGAE